MAKEYLGQNIPKLGFGLMRLPGTGDDIDIEQVKEMVDKFMAAGFTYFDTAYVYNKGKSEAAAREALVERYPRESFQLATKLPLWDAKSNDEIRQMVQTSLDRAGVSYFDFYLLHALNGERLEAIDQLGAWDLMRELKEKGTARHIGFSFHDTADVLEKILSAHPEMEFVQLQINYADWEDEKVQARLCYETARRHGKSVIIMEPVKGGSLAGFTPSIQKLLTDAAPDASVASWAIRFAAGLEGVVTVLSGMSNLAQMEDNLSYMKDFKPLSDAERGLLAQVVEGMKAIPTIPCTRCKYCVDGCPMKINIPDIFRAVNSYRIYGNLADCTERYARACRDGGKASACIACGNCETHCPQHIAIIEELKAAADLFEK